jgi:hypothetical protein
MLADPAFRNPLTLIFGIIKSEIVENFRTLNPQTLLQTGRICSPWAGLALACRAIAVACKAAGLSRLRLDRADIYKMERELYGVERSGIQYVNWKEGIDLEYFNKKNISLRRYFSMKNIYNFGAVTEYVFSIRVWYEGITITLGSLSADGVPFECYCDVADIIKYCDAMNFCVSDDLRSLIYRYVSYRSTHSADYEPDNALTVELIKLKNRYELDY